MPCIAIIDDRKDLRETLATLIEQEIEDLGHTEGWDVIHAGPFPRLSDYAPWIREHEVSFLILDEKLSEDHEADGEAVAYLGHNAAVIIRADFPDLPQFIVTAYQDEEDLQSEGATLDDIVSKDGFQDRIDMYVRRIIRAGQRFADRNESDLAEIAALLDRMAEQGLTDEERERLAALRQNLTFFAPPDSMREALDKADALLNELNEVIGLLHKRGAN